MCRRRFTIITIVVEYNIAVGGGNPDYPATVTSRVNPGRIETPVVFISFHGRHPPFRRKVLFIRFQLAVSPLVRRPPPGKKGKTLSGFPSACVIEKKHDRRRHFDRHVVHTHTHTPSRPEAAERWVNKRRAATAPPCSVRRGRERTRTTQPDSLAAVARARTYSGRRRI